MSINRRPPRLGGRNASPQFCAENFGNLIRGVRMSDGRPLEEIAPQAAMTVPEWEAMEAGQAPGTYEQVLWIVRALRLGKSWMPYLIKMCAGAYPS